MTKRLIMHNELHKIYNLISGALQQNGMTKIEKDKVKNYPWWWLIWNIPLSKGKKFHN